METARLAFDILLMTASLLITVGAARRIISTRKESVQDYVICIFFVFNCLPIFLDYLFGIPQFQYIYWWRPLRRPMEDPWTGIAYDVYMLSVLAAFWVYQRIYQGNLQPRLMRLSYKKNLLDAPAVSLFMILSPYLAILFSGQAASFLLYGDHDIRGELSVGIGFLELPALLLISVYAFSLRFFQKSRSWGAWLLLMVYSFSILWVCGKRYIIAVMLVMYVFFYVNSPAYDHKKRKKLIKILPVLLIALILFSAVYLVFFKVGFRDGRTTAGAQSIYETLRVDFGRDGVTKYTLDMLHRQGKSYLDYPGQTILSMFLIWVPRALWETKPLQHFVYLTADIKGLSPENAGAGITPSWYETCIANFGFLGTVLAVLSIPLFCYLADKTMDAKWRGVGLMLLISLLTQSIDIYIFFLMLILLAQIYHLVMGSRRIRITFGGKQLFQGNSD